MESKIVKHVEADGKTVIASVCGEKWGSVSQSVQGFVLQDE